MCYNHLVITAELHFHSSFQGYPTCHYWSHMARWPDGQKWPKWPKILTFSHSKWRKEVILINIICWQELRINLILEDLSIARPSNDSARLALLKVFAKLNLLETPMEINSGDWKCSAIQYRKALFSS